MIGLTSCGSEPLPLQKIVDEGTDDGWEDTQAPLIYPGFSWVREDRLAGMSHPGYGETLGERLEFLAMEDIGILFSLTTVGLDADEVEAHGMEMVHLPVQDFTAPTLDQLLTFIDITDQAMADDVAVGVHCGAGKGRSGTFLAAWFVWEGRTAQEALAEIRTLRPGSVETNEQEHMLYVLEAHLKGEEPPTPGEDPVDKTP